MPATFLKTAISVHLSRTLAAFGEAEVVAGGVYLWMASAAGGTEYTVAVPCAISRIKRRARDESSGLLEMAQENEVAIRCDQDALPFVPDPADKVCFLIATATAALEPDTDQKKYLLKTITHPLPGTTSVRLTADFHA